VTAPDEDTNAVEGARAAFETYGERFLARVGQIAEVDGAMGRERHAGSEFPRYQAALDCYNSDTYQSARAFRTEAGVATVIVVEGA